MGVERLSPLDLSFLCLEGRHTPMHLGALLIFDTGSPAHASTGARELAVLLQQRATAEARLRRRLTSVPLPPGAAAWTEDPAFDAADHIRVSSLPRPGGTNELAARAGTLLARPLLRTKPLWEMHVIGGLADGSTAILVKIHHALADGLRALQLGMSVLDGPHHARSDSLASGAGAGGSPEADGLFTGARELISPATAPQAWQRRAHQARSLAAISTCLGLQLLRPAPASPLNVTLGPRRRFAMLRLDLEEIRLIRKTHGGTINDILLTVLAGGLRSWLAARGHQTSQPLRALVPVSQRHADPSDTSGNRLSGYLIDLPTGLPDPLSRLHTVRRAMDANKAAGASRGPGAFPALANLIPPLLHRAADQLAAPLSARLFNTVITHVPLPNPNLALGGAPLTALYPVVPLAEKQALGIAITTYSGSAHIGLHADYTALPDLDDLATHTTAAVAELLTA